MIKFVTMTIVNSTWIGCFNAIDRLWDCISIFLFVVWKAVSCSSAFRSLWNAVLGKYSELWVKPVTSLSIFLRLIKIFSFHLRFGLASCIYYPVLIIKTVYIYPFFMFASVVSCPSHAHWLCRPNHLKWSENYKIIPYVIVAMGPSRQSPASKSIFLWGLLQLGCATYLVTMYRVF
jgi:hypothetical protein